MPLQQTSGNSTTDAYGGGVAAAPNYIESVFSTWLYTGNGATQTITNGIDLAGKGGLVWSKNRTSGYVRDHALYDTLRGVTHPLGTNFDAAQQTDVNAVTSFTGTGYTLGTDVTNGNVNQSALNYASWTFRKQPKFFDIVTYTGTGSAHTIAHSLGAVPGCIMVKDLTNLGNWQVYHNGLTSAAYSIQLNLTAAQASATTIWNSTAPTSTVFSVGTSTDVNNSGDQYVAYIFAHNAGGFGLTGTDNVISCGGFTADGSGNATVNLGYEPQWILTKRTSSATNWQMYDTMRGWTVNTEAVGTNQLALRPDLASAESSGYPYSVNSTGFGLTGVGASNTFIYIAIRRGPMKVPTDGTKVFAPVTYAGTGATQTISGTGGIPDLVIGDVRVEAPGALASDRLRGNTQRLGTSNTDPEVNSSGITSFNMNGMSLSASSVYNYAVNYIAWFFGRAPSFFDEVCYTGTGLITPLASTFNHNLGVVPELMIIKSRSADGGADNWIVYHSALGATKWMVLNTTASAVGPSASAFNNTAPTSSVFSVSGSGVFFDTNASGITYVAYLFATCPGVSKVGSYTGTGATQTISCSFTGGARLVLIKRTDSTGNWYIWDTARGMVSGTDPRLGLNTTLAEINNNWVYTTAGGFQIVTADANVNASGGSYVFFAIA
jgi:hypothetical protein